MSLDFHVVPQTDLPAIEQLADRVSGRLTRAGWSPVSIVALDEETERRVVTGTIEWETQYGFWADGEGTTVSFELDRWLTPPSNVIDHRGEDLPPMRARELEDAMGESDGLVVAVSSMPGRSEFDRALLRTVLVELATSTDGYALCHDQAFEEVPLEELVGPGVIEDAVWKVML